MENKFHFITQPAVKFGGGNTFSALFGELLLRENDTNKFPGKCFFDCIAIELGNDKFLKFLEKELNGRLSNDKYCKLSINFETIQFTFSETYLFLNRMQSEAQNIVLEITERHYLSESLPKTVQFIRFAKKLGYQVILDDIDGHGSLNICETLAAEVDGVKFSHRLMMQRPFVEVLAVLTEFQQVYARYNLMAIVEGVSEKKQLKGLYKIGIVHQQGYYFISNIN